MNVGVIRISMLTEMLIKGRMHRSMQRLGRFMPPFRKKNVVGFMIHQLSLLLSTHNLKNADAGYTTTEPAIAHG
jgi:hypothetical protein